MDNQSPLIISAITDLMFLRKRTYKEMYPENLAKSLKIIGKNAQSLPFDKRHVFTIFQIFSSRGRLTIKYLIWIQNTHISTMPPKKKPRRIISGLRNQPKLTRILNEPMSCASDNAVLLDPRINNDADDEEWTPNQRQ